MEINNLFVMRNLTVTENFLFSSRQKIDHHLSWGETLAGALIRRQPFLNVSRGNVAFYTFILLVKNVFFLHGIANTLPRIETIRLLSLLIGSRMFWSINNDNLERLFYLLNWAVVLYCSLGQGRSPAINHIVSSIAHLTAVPIFWPFLSTEFIVDIFCIYILMLYILDRIWGRFDIDFSWVGSEIIETLVFFGLDMTYRFRGLLFDICVIFRMYERLVRNAFRERKLLHVLMFTGAFVYCVHEQIDIHFTRFHGRKLKLEDIIKASEDLKKIVPRRYRF